MTGPVAVSQEMGLALGTMLGICFGFFLGKGGLGNPHKLTGVFYFTDFVVPKVMFTAIVVASSGMYLLSDLNLLDIGRIWIVPTYFWPQIAGGALFGIGFVISGYCPGTAIAGLASGRLDALFTMIGIGAGSFGFAVAYPFIENFYESSAMGTATLPGIFHTSPWIVLAILLIAAAIMFLLMEWYERKAS